MKATLIFNLPEENEEFDCASKGMRYKVALFNMDQWLRSQIKYKELTEIEYKIFEESRNKLHEILSDDHLEI